ncbi:MAG: hypothetical protein OQJ96_08185 [Flavobacteriales bacterium]|nr:hypothetical protein [Flavobacteriales bacterium]MCW8913346.1 hypothetical protein [Flavobacteriales bacterium]MCW8936920.1 hypothetical protein [Flavobacteriales bacterium]MCW8939333.1 hypothetical protein [Flavobacteriales bacterium]MCW8968619.1 hypothetical protein [Flavobacteriales bacterium]
MKLRYIIFLFLMGLFFKLSAQQHEIGGSIGVGQVLINQNLDEQTTWMNPFDIKDKQHLLVSFDYYYTPKNAIFKFKTGIEVNHRNIQRSFPYFKTTSTTIPIGLELFSSNKKVQFIVGFGFLNVFKTSDNSIYKEKNKNYTLLFEYNFGVNVRVSSNKRIGLMYQKNNGITGIYNEIYYSHSPSSSSKEVIPMKYYDSLILLKFIYSFNKN